MLRAGLRASAFGASRLQRAEEFVVRVLRSSVIFISLQFDIAAPFWVEEDVGGSKRGESPELSWRQLRIGIALGAVALCHCGRHYGEPASSCLSTEMRGFRSNSAVAVYGVLWAPWPQPAKLLSAHLGVS